MQVEAKPMKGAKLGAEHLLRLGSALDVNRSHLLACSSAQEGMDRSFISPRPFSPCPEGRAAWAAPAAQKLHDSPDSLGSPMEPDVALSQHEIPVMLRRQLAADVAADAPSSAQEQPDEATQLGAFRWDLLERCQRCESSADKSASSAESGGWRTFCSEHNLLKVTARTVHLFTCGMCLSTPIITALYFWPVSLAAAHIVLTASAMSR